MPRNDKRVAYYNAQYVRALRQAASLAAWAGEGSRADRWENRADATAAAASTFWDGGVGVQELAKSPGSTATSTAGSSTAATRAAGTFAQGLGAAWCAASGW